MFGDVFGSRSDYSSGMMYAARRSYLVGAPKATVKKHRINSLPKPCKEEVLKPPEIFLTRKQARRQAHGSREDHELAPQNVRQLEFKSAKLDGDKRGRIRGWLDEPGKGMESAKRKDSHSKKYDAMKRAAAMAGDSASDVDSVENEDLEDQQQEAWEQVKQAGVVFWHNTVTGEAQVRNPFVDEATDEGSIGEEEGLSATRVPQENEDIDEGRDLFAFLETENWIEEE